MASRADIYRARAAELEATAEAATDAKTRTTYAELAKEWRDLARDVAMWEDEPPEP